MLGLIAGPASASDYGEAGVWLTWSATVLMASLVNLGLILIVALLRGYRSARVAKIHAAIGAMPAGVMILLMLWRLIDGVDRDQAISSLALIVIDGALAALALLPLWLHRRAAGRRDAVP
ncbi:MAG: hypothetical protein HOQ32_09535 [Lysobacter sp.]|nr:hypothetical protein [Lysobacter sp.]